MRFVFLIRAPFFSTRPSINFLQKLPISRFASQRWLWMGQVGLGGGIFLSLFLKIEDLAKKTFLDF